MNIISCDCDNKPYCRCEEKIKSQMGFSVFVNDAVGRIYFNQYNFQNINIVRQQYPHAHSIR